MKTFIALVLLFLLQQVDHANAQPSSKEKYDIYYIVIGSEHYTKDETKNRPEATNSANQMQLMLQKLNAHYGVKLISHQNQPLTKLDVHNAVGYLKKTIRQDKPKNPLIVFYYMGHGIGNSDGRLYLALGDYDFEMNHQDHNSIDNANNPALVETLGLQFSFFSFDLNNDKNSWFDEDTVQPIDGQPLKPLDPLEIAKKIQALKDKNNTSYEEFTGVEHEKTNLDAVIRQAEAFANAQKLAEQLIDQIPSTPNNKDDGSQNNREVLLKEAQEKLKALGKREEPWKNFNDPLKSVESAGRVPYIMIIDSCSTGLESGGDKILRMREDMLRKMQNNYPNYPNYPNKAILKNVTDMMDKWIVSTPYVGQSIFGSFRHLNTSGAVFLATNPDGKTAAFDPKDKDTPLKNSEKVGILAKRFEVALKQAISSQRNVTLGDFIKMFSSSANSDDDQEKVAGVPKPFSWFDMPPSISEKFIIESPN